MSNNPLQSSGLIKMSEINVEKLWDSTDPNTLKDLATELDGDSDIILNTNNPDEMVEKIGKTGDYTDTEQHPYALSDWYGYDHSLADPAGDTDYIDISSASIPIITKEEGVNTLAINTHLYNLYSLYSLINSGSGDSINSTPTYLEPSVQIKTSNLAFVDADPNYGSTGAYNMDYDIYIDRSFIEIDMSSVDETKDTVKVSIFLTGVSNSYDSNVQAVLCEHEDTSDPTTSSFNDYGQQISDVVDFVVGTDANEFILNSYGLSLAKSAISANGKLRCVLMLYKEDLKQKPFFGDNLIIGDDSTMDTVGNWLAQGGSSVISGGYDDSANDINRDKVLKYIENTDTENEFYLNGSNFGSSLAVDTFYFVNYWYRWISYYVDSNTTTSQPLLYGRKIEGPSGFVFHGTEASPRTNFYQFAHGISSLNFVVEAGGYSDIRLFRTNQTGRNEVFVIDDLFIGNIVFDRTHGNKYTFSKCRVYSTIGPPEVDTISSSVIAGGATLTGYITNQGGSSVTENGFYVKQGTGQTPTSNDTVVTSTDHTLGYTADVTGLADATTYSYVAFATNAQGTTTADDILEFTTDTH